MTCTDISEKVGNEAFRIMKREKRRQIGIVTMTEDVTL